MKLRSIFRHIIDPSLNWVKYGTNTTSEWYRHLDAPMQVRIKDYDFPYIRHDLKTGQFQIIKNNKVVEAFYTLKGAAKAAAKI